MKHLILSVILVTAITGQAWSQNTVKKDKIKALFVLMHQDSLMMKTIDAMTSSMVNNMATVFNDTNYAKLGIEATEMTHTLMESSLKKSKENALKLLNGELVDIYDKYFTIEEIDDFTKFYSTKSGQKMLAQMPDISKDIMTVMTTKYQADFQKTLIKDIEAMVNQMKAKQH